MTARVDQGRFWTLGIGLGLIVPTLLACKLLDRFTGEEEAPPAPSASSPPVTSIAPEFEAPPAVTTPPPAAATPDASLPATTSADTTQGDKKTHTPGHPTKDKADAGTPPPKDAGTPPPKDAGTPPPKDAGTPPPKDAGTPPDPKKDAGPDLPKVPSKECVAKCNKSLQECVMKPGPNGLPDIEACRKKLAKCQKACK